MTSAQEAAVDAMAQAMYASTPLDQLIDGGDGARIAAARMLDALLSPTKKPCAECGEGAGRVRGPADDAIEKATGWPHSLTYKCPNPDCTDGFVSSPAPIEGLLEQAKSVLVENPFGGESLQRRAAEPVFRLPSKVRGA